MVFILTKTKFSTNEQNFLH